MKYQIVQGQKIGKKIGFPTINLEPVQLDSSFGVYACEVIVQGKEKLKGVLHYGVRKTTDKKNTLEVHLFDFNQDLYGEQIDLIVGKKIREIKEFAGLKELKQQIEEDIKRAKEEELRD